MTTMKMSSHLSESGAIQPGSLVKVFDDNGTDLDIVGIYIELVIPANQGLETHDLLEDIEHIDSRFRAKSGGAAPSQFFYTLPEHWHHVVLVGDRLVHLNTGFYTVAEIDHDE